LLQALLSLTLGSVKQLLRNDVQLDLHSQHPNDINSSASESESSNGSASSGYESSDSSEWPSVVYLHLPPLSFLFEDPVVATEARLRATELLRTVLKKPEALLNCAECCAQLLATLDDAAAAALSVIDFATATSATTPARCNFIDGHGLDAQLSQRVLVLWSKSLRSALVADNSDNSSHELNDACVWKALGPHGLGRQGAARLLVESLADDDQWLVEALLDLNHAAQVLGSQSAGSETECRSMLHSAARGVFLGGPGASLRPFTLFSEFCRAILFDERVILDLLLSSETKSLEYLLRVLRLKNEAPLGPIEGVADDSEEGQAVALLRRLRDAVTRANAHNLFPYNPRALLSRFDVFFS
jgi:hypothetical protein